jgi:four helix bundle protein
MGIHSETELNRKFVEFAKLLNLYLNHFPKHEKYALANQIRSSAYGVYDLISEGQKRYHKKTTLTDLDIIHEKLRMQLFLANELGYFGFSDGKTVSKGREDLEGHRYLTISLMVDELGRMIGGWIQKIKADNRWS